MMSIKREPMEQFVNTKLNFPNANYSKSPNTFKITFMNSLENIGTLRSPSVSEAVNTSSQQTDVELWTTERVAKYLHVSLKTVFNLRKKGLPYVQLGGAVRFVPQEIKDYLVTNRGLTAHRLRQTVRKGDGR